MQTFLQGPTGEQSSSRLVMVATAAVVLSVWAVCSVMQGRMLDIPDGVNWLLSASIIGKVGGAVVERKAVI